VTGTNALALIKNLSSWLGSVQLSAQREKISVLRLVTWASTNVPPAISTRPSERDTLENSAGQ
jgi:hypothetical protein